MGTACCKADDYDESGCFDNNASRPYSLHSGMMALQQASLLAGMGGVQSISYFEEKIRRAKQEMQTISVKDGTLYIDYQFAGIIPPGCKIEI